MSHSCCTRIAAGSSLKIIRCLSLMFEEVVLKKTPLFPAFRSILLASYGSVPTRKTKLLVCAVVGVLVMACIPSLTTQPVSTIDPGVVTTLIVQTANAASTQTAVALPTATATPLVQYELHVAVGGNDANPGTVEQPFATIERARDVSRLTSLKMQEPIVVHIHGGTYWVSKPIEFTAADSGQNGFDIIYRAAENESPIFSGGINVSGWERLPDSQLWKTVLADVKIFRQLYVNGVRAQRAASRETIRGIHWAAGNHSSSDGIVISSAEMPDLARPQDLELHWVAGWRDIRLPVQGMEKRADRQRIWLRQPWYAYALSMGQNSDAYHHVIPAYDNPFYVENALELLDEPGEWYFNPDTHELFYMPRDGEDMNTAGVVIPQTQTLLEIKGDGVGREVHNLAFDGLSFEYAGWTRASERGTFGIQAQDLMASPGSCDECQEMTPAHIQLDFARSIRFERCRFEHLGAAGLHLNNDVSDVTVQGNLFHDISDGAIIVGHWQHAYIEDPLLEKATLNNLIANNLIVNVGVEYWGSPAITAFYVDHLHLTHNEISNVPYSGISLGWGWSAVPNSQTARNNLVAYNLITDVMQHASDGGGIYTLGQQPETVVEGNVIRRVKDHACLYPDDGSAFITLSNNVCDTASKWLLIWTGSIHNITVLTTYTNVAEMRNNGTNIYIEKTIQIEGQGWTPEAQIILQNAGLESAYSYLHGWLKR